MLWPPRRVYQLYCNASVVVVVLDVSKSARGSDPSDRWSELHVVPLDQNLVIQITQKMWSPSCCPLILLVGSLFYFFWPVLYLRTFCYHRELWLLLRSNVCILFTVAFRLWP